MKDWSRLTLLQRFFRACPTPPVGTRGRGRFGLKGTILSIAIVGTAAAAVATAMSTGFLGHRVPEGDVEAGRLAIAQMEKTKASPYRIPIYQDSCEYTPVGTYETVAAPAGYGVTVAASAASGQGAVRDLCTLEKITVTVTYNGRETKVLEAYKGNR